MIPRGSGPTNFYGILTPGLFWTEEAAVPKVGVCDICGLEPRTMYAVGLVVLRVYSAAGAALLRRGRDVDEDNDAFAGMLEQIGARIEAQLRGAVRHIQHRGH